MGIGKRGPNGESDHLDETRNIRVRHGLMQHRHGGPVIGSDMSGNVHDVANSHCEMGGPDRGLRIKTRRGRGCEVSAITMRDEAMTGARTAISIDAHSHCDPGGHCDWSRSGSLDPDAVVAPTRHGRSDAPDAP